MKTSRLWTATTGATWEDGLIVGSGTVGAIVHGLPDDLTISLTHERFFLPLNARPPAPDLTGVLGGIRAAVQEGDEARAGDLLDLAARDSGYDDGLVWTDPLGICATVRVRTSGGVTGSRRRIDPARGAVTIAWDDAAGDAHEVRLTAPHGGRTVEVEVRSTTVCAVEVELGLGAQEHASFDTGVADGSRVVTAAASGGAVGRLVVRAGTDGPASPSAPIRAVTTASAEALAWTADPERTRGTMEVGADRTQRLRLDVEMDAAPAPTPAETSSASHAELVAASSLRLEDPPLDGSDPIEVIWSAARAGDDTALRRVIEIAYLSGRSNVIASTGELPPTLQGVWQGTWRPAWSADYTMNGNVQNGAIASVLSTGTPELARSLLRLVLPHLDDYRENARRLYGAEGMLLPSRMSTHGRADHFSRSFPHVFWIGCGGWVLRFAADLVSVTGDRSIVDDALWELAEGVLLFAETATLAEGGRRRIVPDYSPENTPAHRSNPIGADATVDLAILRDAARATAILGRARSDTSLDDRWARLASELPPYRIAADGTLAEWADPAFGQQHAHRHASHLYPLWYDIDPAFADGSAQAERLRRAAGAAVAAKIAWRAEDPIAPPGRMEMAFGLVQLGVAAAALGDADAALRCAEWLAVDHWTPALTTTHDAGRIFNLDASGGLPAVVSAMLMGSSADTVSLLPALPARWPRGEVTGLCARGGVVVDRLAWHPAGCEVTVRRRRKAAWLAPERGTTLTFPRPSEMCDATSGEPVTGPLRLDETPQRLRVAWSD